MTTEPNAMAVVARLAQKLSQLEVENAILATTNDQLVATNAALEEEVAEHRRNLFPDIDSAPEPTVLTGE